DQVSYNNFSMSPLLDQERLGLFFEKLSREIRSGVTVYLTGGTVLIYHGIRPATTDIDFGFDATDPIDRESLPELAQRVAGSDIRVQCSEEMSGWSLMPLPKYRERALLLGRYGRLTVKSIHPVDLILAKVHRGYAEDFADGKALVGHFKISLEEIGVRFKEILAAYPASTEKGEFRQRFERFLQLLQEGK
ncbi:MAG: hypothetical protein ACREIQ_03945, partial [Nitrospiria bacterium]